MTRIKILRPAAALLLIGALCCGLIPVDAEAFYEVDSTVLDGDPDDFGRINGDPDDFGDNSLGFLTLLGHLFRGFVGTLF